MSENNILGLGLCCPSCLREDLLVNFSIVNTNKYIVNTSRPVNFWRASPVCLSFCCRSPGVTCLCNVSDFYVVEKICTLVLTLA